MINFLLQPERGAQCNRREVVLNLGAASSYLFYALATKSEHHAKRALSKTDFIVINGWVLHSNDIDRKLTQDVL